MSETECSQEWHCGCQGLALRRAAERDELRASFEELFRTTRSYRDALEQVDAYFYTDTTRRTLMAVIEEMQAHARAALAAPGAGE